MGIESIPAPLKKPPTEKSPREMAEARKIPEEIPKFNDMEFKMGVIAAARKEGVNPAVKNYIFTKITGAIKQEKFSRILNHAGLTVEELLMASNGDQVVECLTNIMREKDPMEMAKFARNTLKPLIKKQPNATAAKPETEPTSAKPNLSQWTVTPEFKQELAEELKDEACAPTIKEYLSVLPDEDLAKIDYVLEMIDEIPRSFVLTTNGGRVVTALKEMTSIEDQQQMVKFAKKVLKPLLAS